VLSNNRGDTMESTGVPRGTPPGRSLIPRFRRRVAFAAFRTLLGPTSGAVPRNYVRLITERAHLEPMAAHTVETHCLEPPHVERYVLPGDLPAAFRREVSFDERNMYRLRDIRVAPNTGLAWLPKGPILGESYGSLVRLLGWGRSALDAPLEACAEHLSGPVVVLPDASYGYFHWLLEHLPIVVRALSHEPDATVILSSDQPRFVFEALDLLNVRTIHLARGPLAVDDLMLVARPAADDIPWADVEALRAAFLPVQPQISGREAIYVSRQGSKRSLPDEADVETFLEGRGFRIVRCDQLSLREQITVFSGAGSIVAPHGAGLSNLAWSSPHQVVEIFPRDYFNDCYARLTASLGADYRPMFLGGLASDPKGAGMSTVESLERLLGEN
jgi:hypothetical protein